MMASGPDLVEGVLIEGDHPAFGDLAMGNSEDSDCLPARSACPPAKWTTRSPSASIRKAAAVHARRPAR